jgi:alpha-glucosidase (family GH31 glycosyl hydrolase)
MIGKYLMTTPIVYLGQEKREVYFPGEKEDWYQFEVDIKTGKVVS